MDVFRMDQTSQSAKNNASDETHLSVASFDVSSLGQLEEMLSLASQPGSPVAARNAHNSNYYTPSNAVHMEIQENAKLPTFNLPVDRTNSSHTRTSNLKLSSDTMTDLDEMIRLSEKDMNLTEMFLQNRDRSSVNMNWNSAGALLSHIGEVFDGDGDSAAKHGSVTSGGSNKGLHFVQAPPVPRSVHIPHSSKSPVASPTITAQASGSGPADIFELGGHPYHRSLPLPIPKRLSPETTGSDTIPSDGIVPPDDAMDAALATAAAIVSHRQTSVGSHGLASSTSPSKSAKRAGAPNSKASKTQKSKAVSSPGQYRSAVPSASILDATEQRSKFGFGENHVVPSVPLPPPTKKPARRPKPPPPPPPSVNNSLDAYERKKQKAKESRVKLNESIERTAIAISLSGTQSKQRAAQLNTILVSSAALRANTLHTLKECERISGEAKKWDRPSFVGTAASLIQALNAQCEALMSEMIEMKRQEGNSTSLAVGLNGAAEQSSDATSHELPSASLLRDDHQTDMHGVAAEDHPLQSSPKRSASKDETENLHSTAKRPRLEQEDTNGTSSFALSTATIDSMVSSTPSMQTVALMLDPRTLIRCSMVSRYWNEIFQGDPAWLKRCMERFGRYNVRQWKDKMEADHLPPCASISLYRQMDAANVKPHCLHEGSLFLGGARMSGKVSAWVSMVERSNGETIRSVVKESDPQSYTSLPVVELRILIQNTGSADFPIVLKEQAITVDASTRRRGEEMKEIQWDDRFRKRVLNLDGSGRTRVAQSDSHDVVGELCRLKVFESVILAAHIHARGCSTTSKFQQKSNFTKVLVKINGTTIPLVVPFLRESS